MNYLVKVSLGLLTCLTLHSCLKSGGPCEEATTTSSAGISISFLSASGQYIYKEDNPLSDLDSLRMFDAQGRELALLKSRNQIPNSIHAYTVVTMGSFFNEQLDQSSYQAEVCKRYFIEYNSSESDSIQVCFKTKPGKCASIFETLRISNAGQTIYSAGDVVGANIILIKP